MASPLTTIAANQTAQAATTGRATVVHLEISSTADAITYVKLYDVTDEPTVASATPTAVFHAPIGARAVQVPAMAIARRLWIACTEEPGAGASAPSAAVNVQVWVA